MKKRNFFLARRLTGRFASLWVSILAILMMFVAASVLLLILGKNPLTAFHSFLQGCGFAAKENYGSGSGMLMDLLEFMNYLAPLILASLAFIAAFKAGLFNIGISGQMLIAGFTAVIMLGEAQPRYKLVMWPFFFIVMSYARIWLEKDNPLYRATGAVSARMKEWIKTKRA